MISYVAYPRLEFDDAYGQPSEQTLGRRLSVLFDTSNIYTLSDGYTFSNSSETMAHPVIVRVSGDTVESFTYEDFSFSEAGETITGTYHFTTFTNVEVIDGYKMSLTSPYGAVEVREALPVNYLDDGYTTHLPYTEFTAYGNGIFLYETTLKDSYGDNIDLGYGQYEFNYGAPFQIPIKTAPTNIFIGNSQNLLNAADGVMDEVKITSATATKTRTRELAGSYDISVEATSPVFSQPDAKTLVLLHLENNSQDIIDAIREPLDSANLDDTTLAEIVSLRNDRSAFINYVNALNITGTIVDESSDVAGIDKIDQRTTSEQLFDLVEILGGVVNSADYYKLAGNFFPSEIIVNNNFKYAAVFSGGEYFIESPGLIHNKEGSIEVWIAPLANLLGDFKRRIYLDSINHAIIGSTGDLVSISANIIKLPNNIIAQQINSIKLFNSDNDEFDFSEFSYLSEGGNAITLTKNLPNANTAVIVDYIPLSDFNDRFTLFKDEKSNLVFGISSGNILYQVSKNISSWKKNEWHRVMITWKTNDKNNLDHLNMFIDGTQSSIIKYGQGFKFNTFLFNGEFQTDVNTKIIPQNINFGGSLDRLYIGTDFVGAQYGFCRMSNLRISFVERQAIVDANGFKIDFDFDGGSKSATPSIRDAFTSYLEDFDPASGFVTNFATAQSPTSGAHDLHIIVRDYFNLVRGVNNGRIEAILRHLIKVVRPAEARLRISITTNNV